MDRTRKHEGIGDGEETYIGLENELKHAEGVLWGNMMGAFGALYAMRARIFAKVPEEYIVDDFFQTMSVIESGHEAIVDLDAVCYEAVSVELEEEFRRKRRIAIGDFQNLVHFRNLHLPGRGASRNVFAFWSHKGLRWIGPLLILAAMGTCSILAVLEPLYLVPLVGFIVSLGAAFSDILIGAVSSRTYCKPFRYIRYFYAMNAAMFAGFVSLLRGGKEQHLGTHQASRGTTQLPGFRINREIMSKPSILVTHPWMGRGGSEATAMWTLQALQDDYEVTFITASPVDWDELNDAYGSSVDPDRIRLVRAPRLPTVDSPLKLVQAQLRLFERFCRSRAKSFDLCVSAYNPVDFGTPGIQLIGDFSFSEEMRKLLYSHVDRSFHHRETPLRRLYLWFAKVIGVDSLPLRERRDLVLANSEWSRAHLETEFGVPRSPVIYPPVILPRAEKETVRDPLGFVCLGRVVPEKEIERVIEIIEAVRENGVPATLRLIGSLDDSPYAQKIARMVDGVDWIQTEGFLSLERKQEILASQTFALHACRIEAFGIAVAEMASMGCVPIVPSTGGAREIVGHEELHFQSNEEAVSKILALVRNPDRVEQLRRELPAQMDRFGPEVFMKELREHVLEFPGFSPPSPDVASSKGLPAYQ